MRRDKALIDNTKPLVEDNVRFAVDGVAPDPWRTMLIAKPLYATAAEAGHMRDDDYVVGLAYKDVIKAFPLWIVDYYHTVHEEVDGEPLVVFS